MINLAVMQELLSIVTDARFLNDLKLCGIGAEIWDEESLKLISHARGIKGEGPRPQLFAIPWELDYGQRFEIIAEYSGEGLVFHGLIRSDVNVNRLHWAASRPIYRKSRSVRRRTPDPRQLDLFV